MVDLSIVTLVYQRVSDVLDFLEATTVFFVPWHWHRSFEECPGKKAKLLPLCPEVG